MKDLSERLESPNRISSSLPSRDAVSAAAKTDYSRVAGIYEILARAYSGRGIQRSRTALFSVIRPGDRVLFVGVGTGSDAQDALERGATLTLLDRSAAMLNRCRSRLAASAPRRTPVNLQFAHENILEHRPGKKYDVIVANYFLNVFHPDLVPTVLTHLVALLAPGGRLLIADFAPPRGNCIQQFFQRVYYAAPLITFWTATRNAWHGLYDYAPMLEQAGLRISQRTAIPIATFGPLWFESICACRLDDPSP